MNLRGGENKRYIDFDIEQGTLVSYLIKSDDLNIKNPMARVFIKPYISVDGEDFVYGVESKDVKYGSAPKNYMTTLLKMLDKAQGDKTGRFIRDRKLYPDGSKEILMVDKNATVEEKLKAYGIENYTINSDGSIDVDGDVNLQEKHLTEIPFKFGKVTGNFDCSNNKLKSLKGSPESVGESFICSENELKSLKGAPESVGGTFSCTFNELKSLAGAPKSVGRSFWCSHNELESLAGAPESVGGTFDCNNNKVQFTKEDVMAVCKVGLRIQV